MPTVGRRPAGLVAVAAVVAFNGLASLSEAIALLWGVTAPPGGGMGMRFAGLLHAVVGAALLYRAHGIWALRPGALMITIGLLVIRLVLVLLTLPVEPMGALRWIDAALVSLSLIYLTQPSVRRLFR